jgi:protein TonB
MVRSLPHPSPFAGLDARRIAGNTLVVTLHLLAFAVLMLPAQWEPPAASKPDHVVVPEWIVPPPKIKETEPPPPKPVEIKPVPPQTTPPRTVTESPPVDTRPVFETGTEIAMPEIDTGPPVDTYVVGPPAPAELALDVHPSPRYPRTAIRAGHEGTVLLRVRVDAFGRPQEVTIERSSGHHELDRSARETVLQRWRFQPAQRDGQPVAAWGLVPIRFTLP